MLSRIQAEPGVSRAELAREFGFSEMAAEFEYGPDSSFRLVKGEISPSEAASLLALHAFCYSDQLDFDRLRESLDTGEEVAVNA